MVTRSLEVYSRCARSPSQRPHSSVIVVEYGMQIDIYSCEPGWEIRLSEELGRVCRRSTRRVLAPGWVESACDAPDDAGDVRLPSVALAAQCMPDAQAIEARSISMWARHAAKWLIARLDAHDGPWRLHVFCVPATDGSVTPARCDYIQKGIVDILRKQRRRLLRTASQDPRAPLLVDEWLLQVGLRTATAGYFSALAPDDKSRLRHCVSRFPGGIVEVPLERQAPSRAFAKLAEVELRLNRQILPKETCVDLGSSPGSWAWWALRRGANVLAVDRSPLRDDLMRHAALKFVRGDAFRYCPPQGVDWLLCDVIAFPAKTIALVERWLAEGWCRWLCVTIKFRGQNEYDQLERLKIRLSSCGDGLYLRRLTANKNEVMLFGRSLTAEDVPRSGL